MKLAILLSVMSWIAVSAPLIAYAKDNQKISPQKYCTQSKNVMDTDKQFEPCPFDTHR